MRTILRLLAVVVVVLAIAVGAAIFYLDSIAASVIESEGTRTAGVPVAVDAVRLGLVSGRFRLQGLEIANPPGFDAPHFFKLADSSFELPLRRVLDDPIVAPRLEISGIELVLERAGGKTNYGVILDSLGSSESATSGEPSAGPGFVLQELVIRDLSARVRLAPGGELTEVAVGVPEIRLTNLGSSGAQATELADVLRLVVVTSLQAVAKTGANLPGALVADLDRRLGRVPLPPALRAEGRRWLEQLGKREGGRAQQLLEGAGEGAGKALEGIGRFLPGKGERE